MKANVLFYSLIDLGALPFDAKLYQYLLDNPVFNISRIAKELATNRVRIYDVLKRLEALNLVEKTEDGTTVVVSPIKILSQLRLKENSAKKLSSDLEEIMPELLYKIESTNKIPAVRVYEGKDNIVRLATEIVEGLQPNSELLWLAEGEELYEITGFEYFIKELGTRRHNKSVRVRILASYNNPMRTDPLLTREFRFLPKSFETPVTITIAGNKIVYWNTVNPKVIVIEDRLAAKVQTQIFDLLWESAIIRD